MPKKRVRRMPVPEGKFTTNNILALAKARGLTLTRNHITDRLRLIRDGKRPWPEGLEQDMLDPGRRYFFPEALVNELLAEARQRKNLPRHLKAGRVLPLEKLASELGLKKDAILRYHYTGKLNTFLVSGKRYVTRRESNRFKEWYKDNVAATMSSRGGKARVSYPPQVFRIVSTRPGAEKLFSNASDFIGEASARMEAINKMGLGPTKDARKQKLFEELGQLQRVLDASRKKFLDAEKSTNPDLIAMNNLNIASLRAEVLGKLLVGIGMKNMEVKVIVSEIMRLIDANKVLGK